MVNTTRGGSIVVEVEAILGFCNVGLGCWVGGLFCSEVIPICQAFISVIATTEIGQSNMVEMQ